MNAIFHNRKQTGKPASYDPGTDLTLKAFFEETDFELQCDKICGKQFKSLEEHTDFVKNGGCSKLIQELANTAS